MNRQQKEETYNSPAVTGVVTPPAILADTFVFVPATNDGPVSIQDAAFHWLQYAYANYLWNTTDTGVGLIPGTDEYNKLVLVQPDPNQSALTQPDYDIGPVAAPTVDSDIGDGYLLV